MAKNVCESVRGNRPCGNPVIPGSKYCNNHGGHAVIRSREKMEKRQYHIEKYNQELDARIKGFEEHSRLTSQIDELAILKALLDNVLSQCTQPIELLSHTPMIADLVQKVDKTVCNIHKMQKSMNMLLDKQVIAEMISAIIDVVTEEINDPKVVKIIQARLKDILARDE